MRTDRGPNLHHCHVSVFGSVPVSVPAHDALPALVPVHVLVPVPIYVLDPVPVLFLKYKS
jgi:hypothetical protein